MKFLVLVCGYAMLVLGSFLEAFGLWMDVSYTDVMPAAVFSSGATLTSGHFSAGAGLAVGLAVACFIFGTLAKSRKNGESHAP